MQHAKALERSNCFYAIQGIFAVNIIIDTEKQTLNDGPLYSDNSFELIANLYGKIGWNQKMPYTYTWLGLPVLQIPEDMIRMQEVVYRLRPDVIVETGIAHGGSLLYYASLCKMMDHGRVVGIERGLRCREQVEQHALSPYITMIEGNSVDPKVVAQVHEQCEGSSVLVILDSDHSKAHVVRELQAYSDLIRPGYYIVACDGNLRELADVPRGKREWKIDNPQEAALDFVSNHAQQFVIEQPHWPFNESALSRNVTYWPSAWIRRQGD
jgi:cephalosporin hydroxylase